MVNKSETLIPTPQEHLNSSLSQFGREFELQITTLSQLTNKHFDEVPFISFRTQTNKKARVIFMLTQIKQFFEDQGDPLDTSFWSELTANKQALTNLNKNLNTTSQNFLKKSHNILGPQVTKLFFTRLTDIVCTALQEGVSHRVILSRIPPKLNTTLFPLLGRHV